MKRILLTTKIPLALALAAALGVAGCSSTTTSEQAEDAASASAEAREADKTASPVTSSTSASATDEATTSDSDDDSDSDDGSTSSNTPSRTKTKSSTAVPTAAASDAKDADLKDFATSRKTASASDDSVLPGNIRVKRGKKYDSVYFPYTGDGTPGYDVRYVETAAQEGSGDPISLEGDAILSVTMKGVGYPDPDTTTTTFGRVGGGGEVVESAWNGAPYEGTAMSFLGVSDEQPFRVRLDKEGKQLIVDVAHQKTS